MTERILPLPGWMPDRPAYANPGATHILNAIPDADGYRPMPSLNVFSDALDARCQGAISARDTSGNIHVYAGDAAKLYLMSDATWAQRSSGHSTPATDVWRFTVFDTVVLATNYADEVQAATIGGATSFSAAFTSTLKPNARYIMSLRNFVVAADTNDGTDGVQPSRAWWCGFNDFTDMDPAAATQSDFENLREGGHIKGLVGGAEYGLIFQETQVNRMTYTGGDTIFQFDPIDRLRGTQIPNSIIGWGRLVFFISDEGFFVQDGIESTPIGHLQVDRTFWNQFDLGNISRVSAAVDPINKLVMWSFPGAGNLGGAPNIMYIYNWADKRWSQAEVTLECIARLAQQGYTLDGLDSIGTNIDDAAVFDVSFDSQKWQGGKLRLTAFDTDHKLSQFDGPALAATLETSEFSEGSYHSTIDGATPLVDGGDVSVSIASRQRLKDVITYGAPVEMNPSGTCPLRGEGKYHRMRISLSSSVTWSHMQGIVVDPVVEGDR